MNKIKIPFLLSIVCLMLSCKKERPKVYTVPSELQSYIDKFEQESGIRGEVLFIDDLVVEYGENLELDNVTAAGLCHYETDDTGPRIELDTTSLNWDINEHSREALVFHELGHCILDRPHINTRMKNGNYKSIMKASGEPVFAGFNLFKRDYYIDELFDSNTPEPDWANVPEYSSVSVLNKTNVFTESFSDNSNQWYTAGSGQVIASINNGVYKLESTIEDPRFVSKEVDIDSNADFEIEMSIKIVQGNEFATCAIWGSSDGSEATEEPAKLNYYGFNIAEDVILLDTFTGDYLSLTNNSIDSNGFNKLTIRRQGEFVYFYVNETFHEIITFQEFYGNLMGIIIPSLTTLEVDFINVYRIDQ